jgi:cytochrome P450
MIKEHGCKPCPHYFNKDPILGLDVLRANLRNSRNHKVLHSNIERHQRFGANTFHSRIIYLPVIATCEPENIKTILSLKFKDYSFGNRKKAFAPLLGDGIFNSDGERWANSRHLLRPNFAREQVADLDSLERHFKLMLKYIPKDGTTVDLQELFFSMTMDTATEFLFNHSTNSLKMMGQDNESNEDTIFAKAFNYAQADVITRIRFGPFYRFKRSTARKGNEAIRICHAYVDKWVDDAVAWREQQQQQEKLENGTAAGSKGKQGGEERYVFIHELAKQTSDKKRIRDELINILLAGRDTTASLLSNMFFEIAKRPEIWQKLRDEVASLQGRMPTYEELRGMKYVKWCLNECELPHLFLFTAPTASNNFNSTPPQPGRTWKLTLRHPRHCPPTRRRPRRPGPTLRPVRHTRSVQPLYYAPPQRHLRS